MDEVEKGRPQCGRKHVATLTPESRIHKEERGQNIHIKSFTYLPFKPDGAFINTRARIDGRQFVCVCLHAYAAIVPQRHQVVDNLRVQDTNS